jgi:hypothetical protein
MVGEFEHHPVEAVMAGHPDGGQVRHIGRWLGVHVGGAGARQSRIGVRRRCAPGHSGGDEQATHEQR